VITDKSEYVEGETIVISGEVISILADTPIIIQILNTDVTRVEIAQKQVAQDGSFTHTVFATGPLWQKDGEYRVQISYGPNDSLETTFSFSTEETVSESGVNFEVDAGSYGTFDVEYSITSASIDDIVIDQEGLALIVSINATNDGVLTIDIPRELTDAKTNGDDDEFIILIDGTEVPYIEEKSSTSRIITIQFLEDDANIEIIGTFIVPEFGEIAVIIFTIAIFSIIGLTLNTKLKIIPKI